MAINVWANQGAINIPRDVAQFRVPETLPKPEFWRDVVRSSLGYTYAPIFDNIKNSLKYGDRIGWISAISISSNTSTITRTYG